MGFFPFLISLLLLSPILVRLCQESGAAAKRAFSERKGEGWAAERSLPPHHNGQAIHHASGGTWARQAPDPAPGTIPAHSPLAAQAGPSVSPAQPHHPCQARVGALLGVPGLSGAQVARGGHAISPSRGGGGWGSQAARGGWGGRKRLSSQPQQARAGRTGEGRDERPEILVDLLWVPAPNACFPLPIANAGCAGHPTPEPALTLQGTRALRIPGPRV